MQAKMRSTGRPGRKLLVKLRALPTADRICASVAQSISRKEAQGRNVHFPLVSNLNIYIRPSPFAEEELVVRSQNLKHTNDHLRRFANTVCNKHCSIQPIKFLIPRFKLRHGSEIIQRW